MKSIPAFLRQLLTVVFFLPAFTLYAQQASQPVSNYFEKIRDNEAKLTAFISQMPKGGDLHNHYSGAIYAETYFNSLVDADYCINPATLQTAAPSASGNCGTGYVRLSLLKANLKSSAFDSLRSAIIRLYSTKDYDQLHTDAREDHFFASFGNFSNASGMNYDKGLNELKTRAKAENVSYIETMFTSIWMQKPASPVPIIDNKDTVQYYNNKLIALGKSWDTAGLKPVLQWLYRQIIKLPIDKTADDFNHHLDSLHLSLHIDDPAFTMRYQTFIVRVLDPLTCFINLVTAFNAVQRSRSGLLRAVNIVAPEDNVVSMRDYWLHMQLFAFCSQLYNNKVSYSMHAGELTEGFVTPEQLSWHISAAVYMAGAQRIGHGVDIAYEKDNYTLLNDMRNKKVAVEINLSSNEFILGVKDDRHPVLLYKDFNVPIVISTDDPGVSRSSLTEQYVLLARRYKTISYADVKEYVYNSIRYSFMEDRMKEQLILDLDRRFVMFEKYVLGGIKN